MNLWERFNDVPGGNALRYYLGPAYEPVNALAQLGIGSLPGADMVEMQRASDDLMQGLRRRGLQTEYGVRAADLARDAAPESIVNSAGLWDDPTLVQAVWEDVLEPKGIKAVRTPDGLIRFDNQGVKAVGAR